MEKVDKTPFSMLYQMCIPYCVSFLKRDSTQVDDEGATIFFGIGGVMNFRKYFSNILWPPLLQWSKILWPPSGATLLKKHVTPNARSTENMHCGGYFIQ